jgi:hypothetical protein
MQNAWNAQENMKHECGTVTNNLVSAQKLTN